MVKATARPTKSRPAQRLDEAVLRVLDQAQIALPTGEAWVRPEWMEDGIVRPLLTLGPKGVPRFSEHWLESMKGIGKTFTVLAVHLTEAVVHPGTLVLIAGKDRGAIEVDKDFLTGMIQRSPLLRSRCKILSDKIEVQGGSRIVFLAADEPGTHGGGGTHPRYRVIAEDVFAWTDLTLLDSLLSMSGKTRNARVSILTNPAAKRSGRIWALRSRLKKRHGQDAWFFAPWADGTGPHVEWITQSWKLRMQDSLPPGIYARFVEGGWSEDSSFVTRQQVEACIGPHVSGRRGAGLLHMGLDIGIKRHHSALAWGCTGGGQFYLHGVKRWDPATLPGHEVQLEEVEAAIREVRAAYPGAVLIADPFQAVHMLQALRGALVVEEFSFGIPNQTRLAQAFYEALTKRLIVLPADQPDLVEEIASLDTVPVGFSFRFEFGGEGSGHGDVAVATALAYFSALQRGLHGGRIIPVREAVRFGGERATAALGSRPSGSLFAAGSAPSPWSVRETARSIFDAYDRGQLEGQAGRGGRRPW